MTKDVMDAIRERRSVRRFTSEKIPEATIRRILEAGQWAPSGGNIQPWHFFVVLNEEKKKALAKAALGQNFIEEAPVVIVICALPEMSEKKYGQRGAKLYSIQDTAAAIQNMLLAATAFGLGTCWVGAFEEEGVKQILGTTRDMKPVALIPLGYFETNNRIPARRSLEDIVTVVE